MANPRNLSFTVNVPDYFTASQRKEVGNRIVQEIIRRTREDNTDKNYKPFPRYSKEYKDSLNFRIAGKSPSDVNLTLSGDMLSDLDVIGHGTGYVDIGYKSNYYAADKVEGNVIGSYGASKGNPSKARNFLGLLKADINDLIEEIDNTPEEDIKQSLSIEKQAEIVAKKTQLEDI